ncbi:MAG: SNF2-related protein [Bacteroidales bacterium]
METKKEYRLVFAILEHEVLGALFEGYIVEVKDFRQFSLSHRKVSPRTVLDYDITVSEAEAEILRHIEDYSDEVLLRKFSKGAIKPNDFYTGLSSQVLQDHVRPYIEKRIHQISRLLEQNTIRVFYKGKRKDAIQERPIGFHAETAGVVFNFIRKAEGGTEYFLTIRSNNQEINLTGRRGRVLTLQPCLVYIEDTIYHIDERVDGNKLNPFFTKKSISIPPASERKYYETFVLNAVRQFTVQAEGFLIREIDRECKPVVQLEWDLEGRVFLGLHFGYGNRLIHPADQGMHYAELLEVPDSFVFEKFSRKIQQERNCTDRLAELGLQCNEYKAFYLDEKESTSGDTAVHDYISWLNEHAESLSASGFEVRQSKLQKVYYTGPVELTMEVKEGHDWFDIHAFVRFGNIDVPFIKLKQHILSGTREYVLPNGETAVLPEAWFSRFRDIVQLGQSSGDRMRLKLHHAGILRMIEPERTVSFYNELTSGIRQEDLLQFKVPDSIEAKLRPYQLDGYKWMSLLQKYELGGCLADDMGLGKTLQTLVLLASQGNDGQVLRVQADGKQTSRQLDLFSEAPKTIEYMSGTSLIVMPLSLIWNWENEIRKFTPHFRVYKHFGSGRTTDPAVFYEHDLVLTTYGVVRNDLQMFSRCEFRYVILDESQIIKNPFSKLYRAVKLLKSKYKLVLTGTPVENSLSDLWAQMSFLNSGMLGSLSYFKDEFALPIEKFRDRSKEEKLKTLIAPFLLRRTKEMVARDLPSLTETIYYCEMGEEQKELYESKKSEIRNLILESFDELGAEKSRFAILRGLMQLRLLANHSVLMPDGPDYPSGKFEEVMRSIRNILAEGHKVLIFSSFVKHLRLFSKEFDAEGWGYCMLTGEKSSPERAEAVRNFQEDPEKRLFLITLKAGGVGLNLTAADYVFMLDPWWNPASENQAISRAHRIGQDKKVIAFKFITRDTIEEKILSLQQNKSEIASLFVNNNDPLKFFTRDTILQLTE